MKASIIVTPKKSVLDPQGEAVRKAIQGLGMEAAESVRVGKYIELELKEKSAGSVQAKLKQICQDLLSNPVIEDYQIVFSNDENSKENPSFSNGFAEKEKKTRVKKEKVSAVSAKKEKKKKD